MEKEPLNHWIKQVTSSVKNYSQQQAEVAKIQEGIITFANILDKKKEDLQYAKKHLHEEIKAVLSRYGQDNEEFKEYLYERSPDDMEGRKLFGIDEIFSKNSYPNNLAYLAFAIRYLLLEQEECTVLLGIKGNSGCIIYNRISSSLKPIISEFGLQIDGVVEGKDNKIVIHLKYRGA